MYSEDEYFRFNVKKFIAFAVIPVDDIITAFGSIVNQFGNDADELLDYFEKTWIAEGERSGMFFLIFLQISYILDFLGFGCKNLQIDHKRWSIHDRVVGTVPYSNNLVEVGTRLLQLISQ